MKYSSLFYMSLCLIVSVLIACGGSGHAGRMGNLAEFAYNDSIVGRTAVEIKKSDFTEKKILSIEHLMPDIVTGNNELKIISKNGYLIIKSLLKVQGEHLVTILDEKTLEEVKKIAPFGGGPEEFMDVRVIESHNPGILAYLMDPKDEAQRKVWALNDDLTLTEQYNFDFSKYKQHFWLGCENPMHIGGDSFLLERYASNGKGLHVYNAGDSTLTNILSMNFSDDFDSWWLCYLGSVAYNPGHKRIAYAFQYYDRIVFADIDGKNLRTVQPGEPERIKAKTRSDMFEKGDHTAYYGEVMCDDYYFYALYRGHTVYDPANDDSLSYYIEQFDMEGKPVARYKLPAGKTFRIGCVSPGEKGVVYLINIKEDDYLYKVRLF